MKCELIASKYFPCVLYSFLSSTELDWSWRHSRVVKGVGSSFPSQLNTTIMLQSTLIPICKRDSRKLAMLTADLQPLVLTQTHVFPLHKTRLDTRTDSKPWSLAATRILINVSVLFAWLLFWLKTQNTPPFVYCSNGGIVIGRWAPVDEGVILSITPALWLTERLSFEYIWR